MQIDPYLNFNGNCEEAFNFYAKVLNGKIEAMMTHAGTPAEQSVSEEWKKKIMHARMRIGDRVLMASDAPPQYQSPMKGFAVSITITDLAEAERVFKALSEGGQVSMAFAETFWAKGFAMFKDRFGTPWMVNCPKPM